MGCGFLLHFTFELCLFSTQSGNSQLRKTDAQNVQVTGNHARWIARRSDLLSVVRLTRKVRDHAQHFITQRPIRSLATRKDTELFLNDGSHKRSMR